ncbi:MAG TPA: HAMP domain-containing sensor histidine kinase [Kofleriaceae bacterium]|nr:HAMP domain-containing sensor histidine kinase [Kofleriaceae bacterium]
MRRVLLVNALIFAVLAAAVALAYYGYSYTSEVSSNERELALLQELADERVLTIESDIEAADLRLVEAITQIEPMSDLGDAVRKSRAAVRSVFVLDDRLRLLPDGTVSTRGRAGIEFRDKFLANILPELPLAKQPVGKRGHYYRTWEGRPFLFSFIKKVLHERTFYVVIEEDLVYLVNNVFQQFFSVSASSKRIYQVLDEKGGLIFGFPLVGLAGPAQESRFLSTVDGWVLRVTQKDIADPALERRQLIDSLLIGVAVTVILGGLTILGLAIRRERRLNELKSEFISNVSHELKTPLSIISMFGEMLAEGRTKSPEQAHEYAEIIWRESVRLGRLIDNVLDFAKIERGMGVYEFGDADLGEVIDRVVVVSARRVAAAEMTLEVDIEPDLPPVHIDASAITLAVLNLIDNAIKYAPDGKRIALGVRRVGERIIVTVRDWGPGIDPEEHERIFDRFYRARAIRLKPIRGSGIGLALVQHIARAHHGDAAVTSAPQHGASFRIWLPISGNN